ncbi:MAG: hypothetical protein R3C03_05535 [Pirellulaceae bacterium]
MRFVFNLFHRQEIQVQLKSLRQKRLPLSLTLAMTFLGGVGYDVLQAQETQRDWTATSGIFTSSSSWANGVPDTDDLANFSLGGNVTVQFTISDSLGRLQVFNGTTNFKYGSNPFNSGNRIITTNTNSTNAFLVGNASATANIDEVEFVLANGGGARVTGGTLSIATSSGTSTRNSKLTTTGAMRNNGTVNVGNRGTLTVGADNFVGLDNGYVGTFNIANGANASNQAGWIGMNSGSQGAAVVEGVWANTLDLTIANSTGTTGSLTVQNGGIVNNTIGYIGRDAGCERKRNSFRRRFNMEQFEQSLCWEFRRWPTQCCSRRRGLRRHRIHREQLRFIGNRNGLGNGFAMEQLERPVCRIFR